MEKDKENRSDLLHAVTSPLGFFALSLLIVEGFLTISLVFSDLGSTSKFWGMIIGAVLFILVVVLVWILVWYKPENLTFGEDSHLKRLQMEKWGNSDNPVQKAEAENSANLSSPVTPE